MATGCGRVHQVHYAGRGVSLNPETVSRLDLAYAAPGLEVLRDKTLLVKLDYPRQTIQPEGSKIRQIEDWEVWRQDFEDYLADRIWRSSIFKDVATQRDQRPLKNPDYTFEFAMTQWNEGVGWLRYFLGFGLGATDMQWEGRLIDARSKKVLFAFADRRLHPGGPSWVGSLNFKPFYGGALIAQDLRWATDDLIKALRELTETNELERTELVRHPQYRAVIGEDKPTAEISPADPNAAAPGKPKAPTPGLKQKIADEIPHKKAESNAKRPGPTPAP